MDKYVEVFAANDITFAYLIKASLENAGIPVQITNENLQGAYCLDGMVPKVLVPESYIEQAKQIIEEIQEPSQHNQDDDEDEISNMSTQTETHVWGKIFDGCVLMNARGQYLLTRNRDAAVVGPFGILLKAR